MYILPTVMGHRGIGNSTGSAVEEAGQSFPAPYQNLGKRKVARAWVVGGRWAGHSRDGRDLAGRAPTLLAVALYKKAGSGKVESSGSQGARRGTPPAYRSDSFGACAVERANSAAFS